MNVILFTRYSWGVDILRGLVRAQAGRGWKVSMLVVPSDGSPKLDGVQTLVVDPTRLEEQAGRFKRLSPCALLFYGWSWLIPKPLRDAAPCLVLHPSPLPKYRGGSPIQNQLIDGVKQSAVTILYAVDELDAGDVLAQAPVSFEGYLDEITARIAEKGLELSIPVLDGLAAGRAEATPQDGSKATVCKRRTPAMSEITPDEMRSEGAERLYDKIRGLQPPYPEAFITCGDGKRLYITRAHL